VKKTMLVLCILTTCHLFLSAQVLSAQASNRPRAVHAKQKPEVQVPAQEIPAGLITLYTNLGPKTDAYLSTDGWDITGFNSFGGSSSAFEIGLPFTPKSSSHLSQVRAALQYDGSGSNQVNFSIYSDAGGTPGTLLAGPVTVTNLPNFPSCCTLAVANFTPLALTGGTQYWIVANTPASGPGSDFVGVWNWNHKTLPFAGSNSVNGWVAEIGDTWPAGAVLGTIP
jgi:hypothetical protein